MDEAVHRLKLASEADADACFIEGVKTKELLQSTVAALAPKPVRITKKPPFVLGASQCNLGRFNAFLYESRGRGYRCQDN